MAISEAEKDEVEQYFNTILSEINDKVLAQLRTRCKEMGLTEDSDKIKLYFYDTLAELRAKVSALSRARATGMRLAIEELSGDKFPVGIFGPEE